MTPLFEDLLTTVVGEHEGRRVTVVTSVGTSPLDATAELDWKALPPGWRFQTAPDDDAFLVAAKSEAARTDELVLLTRWGTAPRSFRTLDRAASSWHLPEIALCEVAASLPDGGRVITVLPAAALVGNASRDARVAIMLNAYPDVIAEVSVHQVRGVNLGAVRSAGDGRAAIIVYQRREPGGPVRFATLPDQGDCSADEVVADLRRLLETAGGITSFGFVSRTLIRPGDPLNPGYYSPDTDRHRQVIGQYGAVVPLSHLFTVLDSEDEACARNDLVLACTGGASEWRITAEEAPPNGEAVAPGTLLLRPSRPLNRHEQMFILAYLRSGRAWRLYKAQGGTFQLDGELLARLPLVLPVQSVCLTLAELEEARGHLRRWQVELNEATERLLDIDEAADGVSELLGIGLRVRHRVVAGARVDDLGYRVRTQFPWPLAVLWRSVEGAQPDAAGYMRTLEFAEALACYLGCLAIAGARAAGTELSTVASTAARLSGGTRGVSFSDWTEILAEVRGRSFRARVADRNLFPELSDLMTPDDDVDRALRRLKERRDALAHHRGPRTAGEMREAHQQAVADLRRWVEACEFVSSYPLWRVEGTHWDEIRHRNTVAYRELMGDNESTSPRTVEMDEATVEIESLYATTRDGGLHLLRPMLNWAECPECHRPAVMVLDQYSQTDRSLSVRSLDHGHTAQADQLIQAFQEVGLIENPD